MGGGELHSTRNAAELASPLYFKIVRHPVQIPKLTPSETTFACCLQTHNKLASRSTTLVEKLVDPRGWNQSVTIVQNPVVIMG